MQTPIKLCYILPEYNESTDSHFYHLYEFLEELSKRVNLFLIIEKSDTKEIKLGSRTYVQRFKFLPLRFLESFFAVLKAWLAGYRVFYTHYAYNGAVNAAIISKLFGGKSYYWNCAMNWLFKQRKMSGLGYRLSLRLSDFLVTGTETMKQGYVEHYDLDPEKIKVMPNWINLDRFIPQPRNQNPKFKTILFVHWLSKRKGADMIVPIIRHFIDDFQSSLPNFKLLVVGDGPYKETLSQEIKENNLEKFIELVGTVSNKNIIDYYRKADISLMPSMEEGFPRVLLEAMAMGVPYVASDVGGVREISSETACRFLVKPSDAEMFAHKLEALMSEKETYKNFREEGLENVKKYSLQTVVDMFVNKIIS